MAGFLGKGEVYVDRDNQGKYFKIGNTTKFAISETEAEVKERISKQTDTYGQALDRVALPKPAKITIELDEIDADNLALALRGSASDISYSGSVTSEAVTAHVGYYVELEHTGVSNVVVKDATDSVTYDEGTDYEVAASAGLLKVLSGGAIAEGDVLHVSYDYQNTGSRIAGSQATEMTGGIILEGVNMANNKECVVYVRQARLMPTSPVDFLGDDFTVVTLEGTLITPSGESEPYYVDYRS